MHMTADSRRRRSQRVRRRRGAAPAARPPGRRDRRADRRRQRRRAARRRSSRTCCRWPTGSSSRDDGRDPGRARRGVPRRCRTASRPRSPRALGDDTVVIDCGADFRLTDAGAWETFYGGEHAGSWPYGLPELPGPARRCCAAPGGSPSPAATRPSRRSPSPPRSPPASSSPTSSWSPRPARQRRRQGRQAAPARQRGDGQRQRLRRRRRPPPHPGDRAEPRRRRRRRRCAVSFTPMLVPMSRGILATVHGARCPTASTADEVRDAYDKAYADEPFVHLLPDGPVAADPVACSAPTPCTCRSPSTTRAGRRRRRRRASTTSPRAPPAPPCSALNLALGLPRDRPACPRRSRAVIAPATSSTTSPRPGLPAAGVTAGLKSTGAKDVALVVNDGPRLRPPPPSSPPTGARPPRCCWSQAGRHGRHRHGGRPQLRRRQLLHRPRRLPDHARHRRAGRRAASASAPSTSSSARPA